MTDWGAVSSWVAAGISVTAFGAGSFRAWWTRPQVDFTLRAAVSNPSQSDRLLAAASISNIGDGSAHRVSVYISRGAQYTDQKLAEAALLKPGDAVEFEFNVTADQFDVAELWTIWTPPPIRRRRQQTSGRISLAQSMIELSGMAEEAIAAVRERATA